LELGSGWRIPTSTEWTNVDEIGNWTNWNGPWNSDLKMHAAGIVGNNGSLSNRGSVGYYWSNIQDDLGNGWYLLISGGGSVMSGGAKANGLSIRCLKDNSTFTCGSSITINHVAGAVAPVSKTVTYGTVSNIPGETLKCWTTSNLGADHQATAVDDATEASAGWYWQFNRKQGYKHDGTTRTPNTTWITSINEILDWQPANDPCTIELGSDWRIPTSTEWTNVDDGGNWTTWTGPWNSGLKMHAAGILNDGNGALNSRGSSGLYSSSIQGDNTNCWSLYFSAIASNMANYPKANGYSLRCVKDNSAFTCGSSITINHVAGAVAPVSKTVTYGTVSNIPGEISKCWITSNLGADHQATAVNDATEASAGWYWQFNRKQGYKHDGTNRTPNTTWITSILENFDWQAANDPCAIELGGNWRIPTNNEWENVDASGNWTNWNGPWNSDLKLHAAGLLYSNSGNLGTRGLDGAYWSATFYSQSTGWYQHFTTMQSALTYGDKTFGFSIRCIKDPGSTFSIGQSYGGGIIFYIDGTGQHGLIAATSDQSTGAQWGCYGTIIGANGTTIGTGQSNSTIIINGCNEANIAARICEDLVLNGYSDWYLPSKDELNQMYLKKTIIGGFSGWWYWSSSEYDAYGAWDQAFDDGSQHHSGNKNTNKPVRAIRSF
jgi:hypothetical protein